MSDQNGFWFQTPEWLACRTDLTFGAKLLWAKLADYASIDPSGEGWPSRATLAKSLGTSTGSISSLIGQLERAGLVQVTRGTGTECNRYIVIEPDGSGQPSDGAVVSGVTAERSSRQPSDRQPSAGRRPSRQRADTTNTSNQDHTKKRILARTKRKRDIPEGCWGEIGHVFFDPKAGAFVGITDDDRAQWKTAYPLVDIEQFLRSLAQWVLSEPKKGRKKNYRSTITNNLGREQQRTAAARSQPSLHIEPSPDKYAKVFVHTVETAARSSE